MGESGVVTITNHFTFEWFIKVYSDRAWINAICTSFIYALTSSIFSLLLALIYYYYSFWYRNLYQLFGYLFITIPLFFPLLVYALALKVLSAKLMLPEPIIILLGHISIIIPIQYLILEGSNEKIKMDWLFSAIVMGAKHREIVWKIVVPNISITLLMALGCGFLYSFDEIVISNFIIDSANITVPKKIWLEINRDINPSPGVVYSSLLFVSILLFGVIRFYARTNVKMTKKRKKRRLFLFQDMKSTIISGVVVAMIDTIYEYFFMDHVSLGRLLFSFLTGVVLFEVGFLQLFQIYLWGKEIIDKIYLFRKEEHAKYRELATGLLSHKIDTSLNEVRDFFHNSEGKSVSFIESEKISELLFDRNKGYYFGTDSNVPSKFKDLYPSYLLNSQEAKTSTRILICTNQDLNEDFINNKSEFIEFYHWHTRHNVSLLIADRDDAINQMKQLKLLHSDIGIWDDDYVVIFKPEPPDKIHYWFKSYKTLEETKLYVKYYMNIINKCKQIKIINNNINVENLPQIKKEAIKNLLNDLWKIY